MANPETHIVETERISTIASMKIYNAKVNFFGK